MGLFGLFFFDDHLAKEKSRSLEPLDGPPLYRTSGVHFLIGMGFDKSELVPLNEDELKEFFKCLRKTNERSAARPEGSYCFRKSKATSGQTPSLFLRLRLYLMDQSSIILSTSRMLYFVITHILTELSFPATATLAERQLLAMPSSIRPCSGT